MHHGKENGERILKLKNRNHLYLDHVANVGRLESLGCIRGLPQQSLATGEVPCVLYRVRIFKCLNKNNVGVARRKK